MAAPERPCTHIEVDDDGSVVAFADVERPEGSDTARATLHVEGGHRPPGTGARLVEAILETEEVREAGAVVAAVPRGEAEAIEKVHERLPAATTRSAGATVIVEAELPPED